jgi:TolA-binding protein
MRKLSFFLIIGMIAMVISCGEGAQDPETRIKQLEGELFDDEAIFDEEGKVKAAELLDAYIEFAKENPEDPSTPGYLFKAADISMNMFDPGKAISLYNEIIYKYPEYEKAPESLFLVAYIYENHLQNYGKAEELYKSFIEKYPDNEFADDAEMSIRNMGKSPEELIKEFEEMNQ